MCTVCVRCLVTCMPQWARKGKYGREVSSSAPKCSKVSPSGIENKDRSHRSLKPVLLLFFKILLNLRKPSKPSFRPPFQTLDPIFAQQVAILPTRPDRSSVRSGSQRNMTQDITAAVSRVICPGYLRISSGPCPGYIPLFGPPQLFLTCSATARASVSWSCSTIACKLGLLSNSDSRGSVRLWGWATPGCVTQSPPTVDSVGNPHL